MGVCFFLAAVAVDAADLSRVFSISDRSTKAINASVAADVESGSFLVVWTDDGNQKVLSRLIQPGMAGEEPELGKIVTVWDAPSGHSVDVATVVHGPGTGHYLAAWIEGQRWPDEPGELDRFVDFIRIAAVDESGRPMSREEPPTLTAGRCGASSPALAFDPKMGRWLILWQEHDGDDPAPGMEWQCDVDGAWIVFGGLVTLTPEGPELLDRVEVDISDRERTEAPRIAYSGLDEVFDVVFTSFKTDEGWTFQPPLVRRVVVDGGTGEVRGEPITLSAGAWGVQMPAITALPGTGLSLVVWTRDPGGSEPAVTEGRLVGRGQNLARLGKLVTKRWSRGKSPIITLWQRQEPGAGAGQVAASAGAGAAVVIWEEPGRIHRLRGRVLPYRVKKPRRPTRPIEIGTGKLHPDGHGVACNPEGWCLVAFEDRGNIYGRLLRVTPKKNTLFSF